MRFRILRQQTPASEPYWETFPYDGPADNSVAGVLDYINYGSCTFSVGFPTGQERICEHLFLTGPIKSLENT